MSNVLDHLKTLQPDQIKEMVAKLPKDQQLALLGEVLDGLHSLSSHIVDNADEIWETKTIQHPVLENPEIQKH